MKILKQGRLPGALIGTCTNCRCEVECQRFEAFATSEVNGVVLYVKCPTVECSNNIYLNTESGPNEQ